MFPVQTKRTYFTGRRARTRVRLAKPKIKRNQVNQTGFAARSKQQPTGKAYQSAADDDGHNVPLPSEHPDERDPGYSQGKPIDAARRSHENMQPEPKRKV